MSFFREAVEAKVVILILTIILGILKYSTVLANTNELGGIMHSDEFLVIKFEDLKFFGSTISEFTLVKILNSSEIEE